MSAITIGVLAHVDAGKTTAIESMLFEAHSIRKKGRVDHQDSFLDYDLQERERGITIYSKQAGLEWNGRHIDIIDTPGHADFSAEMERTLSVLDYAVVVVSGLDGVQAHTKTIWRCLEHYNVPAFLFVNKMDISRRSKEELLSDIRKNLSENIVDLANEEERMEQFATLDDKLLDEFMENGAISKDSMTEAIANRKGFPVLFGSALKSEGVSGLLDALTALALEKQYPEQFGARVFKITSDDKGTGLVHLKITGGSLKAKDKIGEQKVDQIRIYSGQGYQAVPEAQAGQIVTVKGLEGLHPGSGLGFEKDQESTVLETCLLYEMILPAEVDAIQMMGSLRSLMLEDPSLQIEYDEVHKTILVHLMGDIQMDVLQKRIYDKTGTSIGFGAGRIVYKETITDSVFGYGHFEPLHHYAEVHLLLQPLKRGSGVQVSSRIRDGLSMNWQRQIINHLQSREHRGVLTGSSITDIKITLTAGRAHNKHTESGDFRQAAFRALRQGLTKADSILLEPFYRFSIDVNSEYLSRILFELENRECEVEVGALNDETMRIKGRGPVRTLLNFQSELSTLSKGTGLISLESDGYDECKDAARIIEEKGYDSELDRFNPSGSVFFTHGHGETIPWDEVEEHLHIPVETERSVSSVSMNPGRFSESELKRVVASAGGQNRNEKKQAMIRRKPKKKDLNLEEKTEISSKASLPVCLIVDGYNMIYSWPELRELSRESLHSARERLIDLVVNYSGYKGWSLIIVFDGWKRKDNTGSSQRFGSCSIVYTPAGQTADSYIERRVHDLKGKFRCIVVTGDALIQNSVLGSGAIRMTGDELLGRVRTVSAKALSHLKS